MANFSLDEWGTPVIGGAISVLGDIGVNNILGGKNIFFNLNPQKVLYETVYGTHPTLVIDAIRYVSEIAAFSDIRRVEIAAEILETVSLVEDGIETVIEAIKAEAISLTEGISREVHYSIPVQAATIGDTHVRGILTGATEVMTVIEARAIGGLEVVKTEIAGVADVLATSMTRVLSESMRIRELLTNSFIPIITGIDEWGNPVIGLMTPLGDVVLANISGGKDFVIRKTSWMELNEVVSVVQEYTTLLTKVFVEVPVFIDTRIVETAKVPFEEVTTIADSYVPLVSAIHAEIVTAIEGTRQTIAIRYLSEVPALVDVLSKHFNRYHVELFALADTHKEYPKKYIREAAHLVESKTYTATHFMSELLQTIEDRKVVFYFSEIPILADTISTTVYREILEVAGFVDSYYRTQFLYEIATVSDDLYEMFWKSVSEMITVADSYRNLFTKIEVIQTVENMMRHATHTLVDEFDVWDRTVRKNPMHYISEIIHNTDLTITYRIVRPIAEVISLGEASVLKIVSTTKLDKLYGYDTRGRVTATRYLADAISVVDSLIGRSFAILTEKIYATDTRMMNAVAYVTDKFKVADTKYKHVYGYLTDVVEAADIKISKPLKELVENVIHVDTRQAIIQTIRTEISRVIDRIRKEPQVYVTNIISFIDGKYISYTKVLIEAFPLIESRYARANHYIIESFKIADSKIKEPLVYVGESINLLETRMMTFYKIDSLVLSDSITRQFARYLSDGITLKEKIRKSAYKAFQEVGQLGDEVSYSNITRMLTESMTIIDTKVYNILRMVSERIKLLDSKISRSMRYLSLENVFASDTRYARPSKILAETTSAVDSYLRRVSAYRQERLRTHDVRNSRVVFAISDLLAIGDDVASRLSKVLTESVQTVDTYIHGATKFLVENTRTLQRVLKLPSQTKTESVVLSDVGVRMILRRVFTDALTAGDSLLRTLSTMKTEALTLVDRKRKEYTTNIVEHFHIGDTIRSFKSLFRWRGSEAIQTNKHKSGIVEASSKTEAIKVTKEKEITDHVDED